MAITSGRRPGPGRPGSASGRERSSAQANGAANTSLELHGRRPGHRRQDDRDRVRSRVWRLRAGGGQGPGGPGRHLGGNVRAPKPMAPRTPVLSCTVDGRDIGGRMIETGYAVAYGDYEREEARARAARVGLWAGTFERPSQWRREHQS